MDKSYRGEPSEERVPASQLHLHEVHFVPLRTQSNLYSVVPLHVEGKNQLAVATVGGEIFCLEFYSPAAGKPPSFAPINLTYIPVDAEVISVDAITKEQGGVIVGVTLVKADSDVKEVYFNIYGIHCDPATPFQWAKIAEDWHPLTLKFIPFQLTHTKVLAGDQWESVFLLAGDDLCVHMYREFLLSELTLAEELSSDVFFPEFQGLPSSITSLDIRVEGGRRLTVYGCQDGSLKCFLVDISAGDIIQSWSSEMVDGPITTVKLINLRSSPLAKADGTVGDDLGDCQLLVGSAVELGVVFMDVLQSGFSQSVVLPSSQKYDSVLCSCVADVNWDGVNELVLGTYGKHVLLYQFCTRQGEPSQFRLIWSRSYAHPIHYVWYGDITHDGLSELVVVSAGGVHVMQHDLELAGSVCLKRIQEDLLPPTDIKNYS